MYSDAIKFPPNRSSQWCDFVKSTLVKNPDIRPSATALLKHSWWVEQLQSERDSLGGPPADCSQGLALSLVAWATMQLVCMPEVANMAVLGPHFWPALSQA